MATENFEGGADGVEITSANTMFDYFTGHPEFTDNPVHGGSLAATGGSGFIFDPGGSTMTHWHDNAVSCEFWAICDEGGSFPGDGRGLLYETFADTTATVDGSFFAGFRFEADDDEVQVVYFDPVFNLVQTGILSGITARGWLKYHYIVVDPLNRLWRIFDTDGTTLLAEYTATIYDYVSDQGFFTTGFGLGVTSQAEGGGHDITIDDFSCPIPEVQGKPKRRVFPRDDRNRIYPRPTSRQASNRITGYL